MTRLLQVSRALLVLLLVSGGAYKLFAGSDLARQIPAVSSPVWAMLGALEVIGGLLLLLPRSTRWSLRHATSTALVLVAETAALSIVYAQQSLVPSAENPLVWSVLMLGLLAVQLWRRSPSIARPGVAQ